MRRHRILLLLGCSLLFAVADLRAAAPVQDGTVLARYEQALASFNAGRSTQARTQFEQLLRRADLPEDLRDNGVFWLGECWYAERAWLDALACFLKVLEHPGSNKEEDARLKIALCWQNLKEPERACAEARALLARFPAGEAAPRARRLLERCPPGE
jgi:TolA-binding protein